MGEKKLTTTFTFGPREIQVLDFKENLLKQQNTEISNNELIRRSLHAWRYDIEIDEKLLMSILSEYLHMASKNPHIHTIAIARSLAHAIIASMISKQGLSKSESFDTVPMNLNIIHELQMSQSSKASHEVSQALGELATSVDTVFLKKRIILDSPKK